LRISKLEMKGFNDLKGFNALKGLNDLSNGRRQL
jgi:hypothetical protein